MTFVAMGFSDITNGRFTNQSSRQVAIFSEIFLKKRLPNANRNFPSAPDIKPYSFSK